MRDVWVTYKSSCKGVSSNTTALSSLQGSSDDFSLVGFRV